MKTRVTFTAEAEKDSLNQIAAINESVERLIKRLGGLVMNSTYILNEGLPSEAYGYYMFPRLGVIGTILVYDNVNSEYVLSVNFSGFEHEEDLEKYNKLKKYIEDTLKKVIY